jgi:hypothetical protein
MDEESESFRCLYCPPGRLCDACWLSVLRDASVQALPKDCQAQAADMALWDWQFHLSMAHPGASVLLDLDCSYCRTLRSRYLGSLAFSMLHPQLRLTEAAHG